MKLLEASRTTRTAIAAAVAGMLLTTGVPAIAQDSDEARIRKLEAEIRALQRRVFPGGDGRYFEPEIAGQPSSGPSTAATPTAVTDILARLDALESSIQSLTAQVEQAGNTQDGIEQRLAVLETGAATRTASSQPATLLPGSSGSNTATTPQQPRTATPTPAPAAAPSPERLAAVRAITKPETDDPGDDDYSYGFRLWEAEFYPEAQQALAKFVEDYPNHSRTTYGRNLLGRAFLDNGQPYEAAPWFLQNYRADSSGARAPDSLLYLARAMQQLSTMSNAPALDAGTPTYGERACIALAQLSEEYPAIAAGRLSTEYEATRRTLDCGG